MDPSFERAVQQPQLVDNVINNFFPENRNKTFTKVFRHLFPESQVHNDNMKSFLRIFEGFHFVIEPNSMEREAVDQLYEELRIDGTTRGGVYQFWTYLIRMYQNIPVDAIRPNFDNIFAFMNEFPIDKTRVVILGQDPSPNCESSGFAFHGSICPTTQNMLNYLNDELSLLDQFGAGCEPLALTLEELNEAKQNCNLMGWIKQGVLMINCMLTYGETRWLHLTDFLVKYISNQYESKVFILVGGYAANKKNKGLIDKKKLFVVGVYHTTHRDPTQQRIQWDVQLPFLNANFFLYQLYREHGQRMMIDWTQISNFVENQQIDLQKFDYYVFFILWDNGNEPQTPTLGYVGNLSIPNRNKVLKLKRLRNGYLSVKLADPTTV